MLFVQSLRGLSHTKLEDTKPEHLELSVAALDRLASKTIDWIAAAMRYELAVEIARPPAEVYAYLADPTHLPEWQEDVEEVRDAPGRPAVGGREVHGGALVPRQAGGVDARGGGCGARA